MKLQHKRMIFASLALLARLVSAQYSSSFEPSSSSSTASSSDGTAVLATADATSDSVCSSRYCLTAVYSAANKAINYTLVVPAGKGGPDKGWYGVGQGEGMAGANMMVGWANADGSITTSQRTASGHSMPTSSLVKAAAYTPNTNVSRTTADQETIISWQFPQTTAPSNRLAHIFAMSDNTPTSSDSNARIGMHDFTDQFTLDMTKAVNSSSSTGSSTSSSAIPAGLAGAEQPSQGSSQQLSSARELTKKNRIIIVHMLFMIIGWMLLAPIGMLVGRYGRTTFKWYPVHRNIQYTAAVSIFIAFILGIVAVSESNGLPHFSGTHTRLGLAIVILLAFQLSLGQLAHFIRARFGVRYVGLLHAPLGLTLFALSVYNIHKGFRFWRWQPSMAADYVIYAWAGLMALLYLAGAALIPREIAQAKAEAPNNHHQKRLSRHGRSDSDSRDDMLQSVNKEGQGLHASV